MMTQRPDFFYEKEMREKFPQVQIISGLDEVGYGAWAGPIVVASCCLWEEGDDFLLGHVGDSKSLTPQERSSIMTYVQKLSKIAWSCFCVPAQVINKTFQETDPWENQPTKISQNKKTLKTPFLDITDFSRGSALPEDFFNPADDRLFDGFPPQKKRNVLSLTLHAMAQAAQSLNSQGVLIDGLHTLDLHIVQKNLVKGDQKSLSIALASIIAKATRDQLMEDLHLQYPAFNWRKNKGYGTAFHKEALIKEGPCPQHRLQYCRNIFPKSSL